jgi:hypothetical protein
MDGAMDLAEFIYEHWFDLRAKDVLRDVLPSARAYKSIDPDGGVDGYDTCDHRIHRRVSIPGSGPTGGNGVVGLVETYFSVRHHNGWGHNLHVHLIEAKNEPLQVAHLAQLFRCMAGIRAAFDQMNISRGGVFTHTWRHRHLYVHGALLGPSASSDVLMAEAMLEHIHNDSDNGYSQPPLRVGCIASKNNSIVSITRIEPDDNYRVKYRSMSANKRLNKTMETLFGASASPMWEEWVKAYLAEDQEILNKLERDHKRSRTGIEEGELSARREILERWLNRRFTVTDYIQAQIRDCEEVTVLDRWLDRAWNAETPSDVFAEDKDEE